MTNRGPRRSASRLTLALVLLTTALSLGLGPASPSHAQVSALPLNFSDVVVFGTNSVRIDHNAQVVGGHVVANTASPGPTLSPGVELGIAKNVTTAAGYAIAADSIDIDKNAVIGGNAFYNSLNNQGTINGTLNTPIATPIFAPLPTFQPATPGVTDVIVANNGTQTIGPGSYRDVVLGQNATLRFSAPGVYHFRSISANKNTQLLFENLGSDTADVRVQNQVVTGHNSVVGPDNGDPLKADQIIVYVGFSSGPGLSPAAVDFGKNTVIKANVYSPNGTLIIGDNAVATGAFLARDVEIQKNAQVDLESFFSTQAPAITSANATTFTVGQFGTFTVTTTGAPTPSIMQSGALPSGVSFIDNGDGTGTLSGTPAAGTGGTYAITFTASNGVPPDAVQNFTLTVNQAPAITSANATTFTVGQAGSFTVTTTGFPTPSITRGGVALPSGVTFTDNGDGTGTLSGTPAAGTGGTYAITFTATNAAGSSPTQNFTLTVNQAPAITSANATTFTVGVFGSFTVTTTGFPTPGIAQGGALPLGVSFIDNGNGTGTLSGTPSVGTGGTYPLTFTASNGVPPNAVQSFTLNVNEAPTITSANATTFTVGVFGSFTVTTTGFPPPGIAQGGALPLGVSFIDNGNGTGTLSGTPAAGTGGIYALTFTASNGVPPNAVQNFTLTVQQPPAITSANATSFTVGVFGSFTVTTTGFPTPSIAQGGALPLGVSFIDNGNGTGTLSGTPAAGTGGVYPLTFTASNGVPPNAVQNFTLTVNAPPTAVDDGPYVTAANTPVSRATSDPDDLLDNDSLGAPPATITSFGGGSLGGTVTSNAAGTTATFGTGSLTVQSNGAFSFTPVTGFTGVFTFQYRLTNGGGTSDATVTIHVRPKAAADTFGENVVGNVLVDTSTGTTFSVLTNDVFNTPVTVTPASATTAQGGSLVVNASTGTFTYNPPVGYEGPDSFQYTITDASGFTSTTATVSLSVSGMIWFVDNNAGSCSTDCNGRLTNPLTTLQAFTSVNDGVGAHPASGDNVFVYESATPYTFASGTLLLANQKLIGQDATASLASVAGVTPPSGSTLPAMNVGGNATTIASTVPLAAGSTVRGLSISTATATGLSGGAVAGVSVGEVRVTTTTGIGVNLNGTGGTVSLISVSANGAVHGIKLLNTTAAVTVTGDGATANSGGTIQNTAGVPGSLGQGGTGAIDLNGTSGTQAFRLMRILAPGGNGLMATNATGTVSMERGTIDHNNAVIANSFAVRLENHAGSATLTLDGLLIQNKLDGSTAVSVSAQDTASVTFNVQDSNTGDGFQSRYTNLFGSGIIVSAGDNLGANGTVNVNVSDTTFINAAPNGLNNLEMAAQQNAVLNFAVTDNVFDAVTKASAIAGIINVNASDSGRIGTAGNPATISGNLIQHIGTSAAVLDLGYIGIRVAPDNAAAVTHRLIVSDNSILDVWRQGILVSARSLATMNLRLEDNTVGTLVDPVGQSNRRGIELETQGSAILNVEIVDSPNIVNSGSSNTNSSLHLRSGASSPLNTTINATVTGNVIGNTILANNTGRFRAETVGVGPGPANFCLDLRNNTLDGAAKEFNLQNLGVGGSVFNLNQSGNVGTITTTGTIGSVASCPLPSF